VPKAHREILPNEVALMGEKTHFGKHLSFWPYRVGNGSKSLGVSCWWNSQRVALQLNFLVWEIQIIWDF
jgi:hypothetical protein